MKLLACGSNGSYQLGIDSDEDQNQLVGCKFLINNTITEQLPLKVIKIRCGGNHTLVLLANGNVFSCGDNESGQCGFPFDEESIHVFKKVNHYCSWKDITCGWEFSVLINENDEIYVCGLGLKGELGLGKTTLKTELTKLPISIPVTEIKSSLNHIIIKSDKEFYGWGNSRKGQLIESKSIIWEPKKLSFDGDIIDYDLTKDTTVLQTPTKLISLGKSDFNIDSPVDSFKLMWSSIHYMINGELKSQGNNSHGQIYTHGFNDTITKFTVGSEHGIVDINNDIYCWGWGEHGNCGHSSSPNHNQITFDKLNQIYKGPTFLLQGGCASTWLVIA